MSRVPKDIQGAARPDPSPGAGAGGRTGYLWSPWRIDYIKGPHDDTACIFCDKLAAPQSEDASNLILARGELAFAMLNAYPYNPERAKDLLREAGYPNGFKFTMAIPGPGIKNMQSQGALIQDQLSKIGVTAEIKPIPMIPNRIRSSNTARSNYV